MWNRANDYHICEVDPIYRTQGSGDLVVVFLFISIQLYGTSQGSYQSEFGIQEWLHIGRSKLQYQLNKNHKQQQLNNPP